MRRVCLAVVAALGLGVSFVQAEDLPKSLEAQLLAEDLADLARDAEQLGDPHRGAVVFFQPHLVCVTCHVPGPQGEQLGPELSKVEENKTGLYLVESLLAPSKVIKKGFETQTIVTTEGRVVSGLLVEDNAKGVVLRDLAQRGKKVAIGKEEIEERLQKDQSIMPQGLVNQLANRQQFLDLVRYLMEISAGGPERARQLRPWSAVFKPKPLPEYEQRLDHAGIIADLDQKSYQRGEAIYGRHCVNCHGTVEREGSLPTALRFATGKFKSGGDPFAMYRTLTHGSGLMISQRWMVPQQKYDVIHYVREAFVKPHNPSQYVRVTDDYLKSLPKGDTRGPTPSKFLPWSGMNYGPNLTATYEVGDGNFAYKGIAVRLDAGPGGVARGRNWMLFDHDTLRLAAAWHGKGFIDWRGINFDGKHGAHPHVVGEVAWSNPVGPGWGRPGDGSFDEVRLRGRDGKPYGPLPRDWAKFRGYYHFQDQLILSYRVGQTDVLEMPALLTAGQQPVYARLLNIGPRKQDMYLQVARHPDGDVGLEISGASKQGSHKVAILGGSSEPAEKSGSPKVRFDGGSYLEVAPAKDFDLRDRDFTIMARIKTKQDGSILAKTAPRGEWAHDGKSLFVRGGRLAYDIGWVGCVEGKRRVDDGRWHDVALSWSHEDGQLQLFVDGKPDGQGKLKPRRRVQGHVVRIGYTAPNFPKNDNQFRGEIAEVRFYRRRLRPAEIAQGLEAAPADELLARWKPVNAEQGLVKDLADGGHHAKLVTASRPSNDLIAAGAVPQVPQAKWYVSPQGDLRLKIPAGDDPLRFTVWTAALEKAADVDKSLAALELDGHTPDLSAFTQGGPPRWPEELTTEVQTSGGDGPFAIDVLAHPEKTPWNCRMRLTGLDFYPDGKSLAVCSWDGDVWLVRGIDDLKGGLTWKRIASGLFQPLGLKIVDGKIYVTCRDQIVRLHDRNNDGEVDFYENFNNDHQVTEHFHEFAMGLQIDDAGNFYYAKSARHALKAVVPHHGTLLRVSKDGSRTDILATGFRAANGVCLNSDGSFFVTDQEGHWMPKNRINWVQQGGFYGNMFGYHDVTDTSDEAMEPPLCWITNKFDRSPAELLWVDSDQWGPLKGSLLSLSYGYGKVFIVPHEKIGGKMQGGMCALPLPDFPTGIHRGRFHPQDGQLYVCGMFAWAGNQHQPGGLYRIRYTGKPVWLPVELNAKQEGMSLTFSGKLDPQTANDAGRYAVKTWSLKRSARYGSDHHNEKELEIASAKLSADGRTVQLKLPDIAPTWCMEIRYSIRGAGGEPVIGTIHNTVHELGK